MGYPEVEDNNKNLEASDVIQKVASTLFRALKLKDGSTGDHSDHVAQITTNFAVICQNGFQEKRINLISMAALIHDIGKIGISDHILCKPEKLSKTEYEKMKKHPQYGYQTIEPLLSYPIVGDVVLYHHENYDGSGYPKGLKGTNIPLSARLVRITDYYEALTSNRPYRPALKSEIAIKIMESNSQFFDPNLFSFFIKNLEDIVS